ncbi:tetratricopeptide repeat protein, partial [Propylenella binzhouense]|uniref:tetratricopeptide repeat protein n=1 Tax=Propylenella binzhouense TaxID=2555902 RepID=UPI001FEA10CC
PWRATVEGAIARAGGAPPPAGGLPPATGPSREEVAAAANMSAADRTAMIEGMVAQLADRLGDNPGDVEGWLRLMRAYTVLGRTEDASSAAKTAIASAPDEEARQRIVAAAEQLGLKIEETGKP